MKQSVAHCICEVSQLPVRLCLRLLFLSKAVVQVLHPNLHVYILQVPCLISCHKLVWGL